MRIVKSLAALSLLAFLLVGVPLLLVRWGDPGYLWTADWGTVLWVTADSRLWLALLAVVGWAAWLVLTLTVAAEAAELLSKHRIRLAIPGLRWLRPAVGALLLAALATPGPALASPLESPPDNGSTAPVDAADPSAPDSAAEPASPPLMDQQAVGASYEVQPGDELWEIAEQQLGSGERWREIAELNQHLDLDRLTPGTVLKLPAETASISSSPEAAPVTVAVQPGDTLWSLSAEHLGNPHRWPEVHALNQEQVLDPDLLEIGDQLVLPAKATKQGAAIPDPPDIPAQPQPPTVPSTDSGQQPDAANADSDATALPDSQHTAHSDDDGSAPVASAEPQTNQPGDRVALAGYGEAAAWLGTLGALLAAGVMTTLVLRRRGQLLSRRMGQRIPIAGEDQRGFLTGLARLAEQPMPESEPSGVLLGWRSDGRPVTLDLELAGLTVFLGRQCQAGLAAVVTMVTCAQPAVPTVLVGASEWSDALDDPQVTSIPDTDSGITELTKLCAQRRLALGSKSLAQARQDADSAEHWQHSIFVFHDELTPAQLAAVADALSLGAVGISVVAHAPVAPPSATTVVLDDESARLGAQTFIPQLLTQPARRALIQLLAWSADPETTQAPWWSDAPLPANVHQLPGPKTDPPEEPAMTLWSASAPHPRLLLLGDVELHGAAGKQPSRARGQCLEYCAWLLEHPGGTPTAMVRDLVIAETTRRSNMSRLRTWLGKDPEGTPYLPDAYTGRITLDPRVDSDWLRFQSLLIGGVNQASTASLREALSLVRGIPLGSTWFQWVWAEQLRADMISMIIDAGCVLADRALAAGEITEALWALNQARRVGEEFDELQVRLIQALAAAGRATEAEAALTALSRATRSAGRDLPVDLALRIQDALRQIRPPFAARGTS